jgi:hypothetical protein
MDQLKPVVTYLAGPMEAAKKDGGANWRTRITPRLKDAEIEVLDPCVTEPMATGMEVLESMEHLRIKLRNKHFADFRESFRPIVDKDLDMVRRASFIIVYLSKDIPTYGTTHELAEAWRLRKPIYLCWKDAMQDLPKWATFLILDTPDKVENKVFNSFTKLTDYVIKAYSNKETK